MPRNKKYTPQDVNSISFINLRKIFNAAPIKQLQDQIQWFAFNNGLFNYFQPAQDKKDGLNGQPLEETLRAYQVACTNNSIPVGSITVVPLLLVVNKRNHFNTLLIQRESYNSYKLFRIEPHKTDRIGLISKYNFETFDEAVKINFDEQRVEAIYTGQQATLNDTQCGAHHINYVGAIAELSLQNQPLTSVLINQTLASKQLLARRQDQQLTNAINQVFQAHNEMPAIDDELPGIMPDRILEGEYIGDEDGFESLSKNQKTVVHHQSIFDLSQNELNAFPSATNLAISSAITILKKYNPNNQKSSQLGFFKKLAHSRQDTASWLINQLEVIANKPDSTVEKAAMFLFGYYNAIQDFDSSLRMKLQDALVLLLGIEITSEYASAKQAEIFGFMQGPYVYDLIINRLSEAKNIMPDTFKNNYKIYNALIAYLEAQETSFLNKVKSVNNYEELNAVRRWIVKIFNSDINNIVDEIKQYPKIAKAIHLEKLLDVSQQSNRSTLS